MNVDRATLLAKIEDLQTIRDLVDETLTSLHALVGDAVEPLDSAPAPSASASAPAPFCAACGALGDGPSRRPTPGARVGPRPKNTAIKMDGALAASIRRACANEAADFLERDRRAESVRAQIKP